MGIGGGKVIALVTHLLALLHRAGSINQMSQNTCHCNPLKLRQKQDFEHHVMERSSDRIMFLTRVDEVEVSGSTALPEDQAAQETRAITRVTDI